MNVGFLIGFDEKLESRVMMDRFMAGLTSRYRAKRKALPWQDHQEWAVQLKARASFLIQEIQRSSQFHCTTLALKVSLNI